MNYSDMRFPMEGSDYESQWASGITPNFLLGHRINGFDAEFMPVPFGFTYSQRMRVKGFYIQSHHFGVQEDATVVPFTALALAIHYQLHGYIPARLYDLFSVNLAKGEYNAFDLSGKEHRAELLTSPFLYHCFHIDIDPAILPSLVRDYPALQPLADRLVRRPDNILNKRPLVISPATYLFLDAISNNIYEGKIAEHYLYPICVSLYCQYARQVDITEGPISEYFKIEDIHLLNSLKDMLRDIRRGAHLGIDTAFLAKKYNTPRSLINALFIQNYFITADDLITAVRLNTAFHLIRKSRHHDDATLARRCGYHNYRRFVADFYQHFGIWPEALAKL